MERETPSQTGCELSLRYLGEFGVYDSSGAKLDLQSQKACAILAYLALKSSESESRERLAGLLWSEKSEEQARGSLRQCLRQLRREFDDQSLDALVIDRAKLSLKPSVWTVDINEIKEKLSAGTVPDILLGPSAPAERLLPDFEALDQAYSSWLHVIRRSYHDAVASQLREILQSDQDQSQRAAEALINIDPTQEEAHRYLIYQYARNGNLGAALRQYKKLWDLLDEEYDIEPSVETQDLIVKIKSGDFEAAPKQTPEQVSPASSSDMHSAQALLTPRKPDNQATIPKIGVCNFRVQSDDEDHTFFAHNFRHEFVAVLARFREWCVVDSTPDDLSSDYVLDGIFMRSDAGLNLILTLKNSNSGQYIWSEKTDISKDNWHAKQQNLIRIISISLNVYISAERLNAGSTGLTSGHRGYDQWLKGYNEMLYWNPMNEAKAELTLSKIIEDYPDFAPAYSCLAGIYNTRHLRNPGIYRKQEFVDKALALSKYSVELDPLDSRNQLAQAWSNAMNKRYDQAEIFFGLAFELNPNSPTTMVPSAQGLSYCGDRRVAREIAEKAVELNPSMPGFHWGYVGCIRYLDKDYSGAVQALDLAGSTIMDFQAWKAAALALDGKTAAAQAAASQFTQSISQAWQGPEPCNTKAMKDWLVHCFPIRQEDDQSLLLRGLAAAGL